MEKEGIKMETHQNWIKASKKTHKRSKSDLDRSPEVAGGEVWPVEVVVLCGG